MKGKPILSTPVMKLFSYRMAGWVYGPRSRPWVCASRLFRTFPFGHNGLDMPKQIRLHAWRGSGKHRVRTEVWRDCEGIETTYGPVYEWLERWLFRSAIGPCLKQSRATVLYIELEVVEK